MKEKIQPNQQSKQTPRITRRDALLGGASFGLAALASPVFAASHEDHGHAHSDAHVSDSDAAVPATQHRSLVLTALECVGIGQMCLQHCFDQFAKGDTSLAACAALNRDMIAACQTLAALGAGRSAQLKAYATVCIDICKACEAECRKHEHHPICIETAEACIKTIAECEKLKA